MASFSRHTTRCLPRWLPRCLPECAFSCQLFLIALARGMHMAVVQLITHTLTHTHKEGQPQSCCICSSLPHLHIERACLSASLPAALDHFWPAAATTFYSSTSLLFYSLSSCSTPDFACSAETAAIFLSAADTNRRQFLLNLRAKLSSALQCASFHHE